MKYHHSQNCAVNSPTMFRNLCVLALVVLCGHAASAFTANMIMGMASKMGTQAVSMGMTCLNKNKATDVFSKPTAEKIVHSGGCLIGCAFQAIGLMKADGTFNTGIISKAIPAGFPMKDKIDQILKDCGNKGGDPCTAPLAFAKCIITDGPMKDMCDAFKALCSQMMVEAMKAAM